MNTPNLKKEIKSIEVQIRRLEKQKEVLVRRRQRNCTHSWQWTWDEVLSWHEACEDCGLPNPEDE